MKNLNLFLDGKISEVPNDAIVVLDVLLRHRPSLLFTTVGRCFYTSDSAATIANGAQLWQGKQYTQERERGCWYHGECLCLPTGFTCWSPPSHSTLISNSPLNFTSYLSLHLYPGFHQSIRATRGHMLINLDVSATAFYQPGPVVDIVAKLLGKNSSADLRNILHEKDRVKIEKV